MNPSKDHSAAGSHEEHINRQVTLGVGWALAARVSDRIVGVASMAILARILIPGDFGLFALAMSAVALVQVFGSIGLGVTLIQKQDAEARHYDTVWTIQVVRGAATAIVLVLVAKLVSGLFGDQRIEYMLYWLALSAFCGGFTNVGVFDFRKHLNFRMDFLFLVSTRLISAVVMVVVALYWRSFWALVVGAIAGSVVQVGLSYALSGYRPRLSLAGLHDIWRFSFWVLVERLVSNLNTRMPVFILGRLMTTNVVGLFSVARDVSSLGSDELGWPVRRAVFPGLSKLTGNRAAFVRMAMNSFSLATLFGLPLATGTFLLAQEIVTVLLGQQWTEAVPILRVLALATVAGSFRIISRPVYLALDVPWLSTVMSAVELTVSVPLVVWGVVAGGVVGAAWALFATSVVLLIIDVAAFTKIVGVGVREAFRLVWRIIVATGIMAGIVSLSLFAMPEASDVISSATRLLASIGAGAASYVASLAALWWLSGRAPGPESLVTGELSRVWPRYR